MKTRIAFSIVVASTWALFCFAGETATRGPDMATPPVVKVVTRTGTVTIRVTDAGPVYTVESPDGKTTEPNLSEMELRAKNKALYELIKPAVATSGAFRFTLDASVGP
jgi:hypothetical protein